MKKLFALFLAVLMVAALAVTASAAAPSDGSVTITNAEMGKSYVLVKAFDALAASGSTSYQIKQGTALYNLIKSNVTAAGITCPFEVTDIEGTDMASVVHKADPQHTEFGRGWLKATYDMPEGWSSDVTAQTKECTAGNTVVFDSLPYGYYMVFPADPDDGTKTSVVTAAPSATIWDKNVRTPSDPDKKANDTDVELGQVVTYTASLQTTNFRTSQNMVTEQITEYVVRDTATALKYKSLNSVKLYSRKEADGTFSDDYLINGNVPHDPYVWNETLNSYTMTVDWVDSEGNSLYPSPAYLVFEYDMYVTEAIAKTNNTATNTFEPNFVIGDKTIPLDNPPSDKVYTSGLSLTKMQSGGAPLTGATFKLSKVENGVEKFYKLVDKSSPVTQETWKAIEWQSTMAAGDEVTVLNDNDIQTFMGLDAGTYKLYEIKAPQGYVAPTDPWTVVITFNGADETVKYSAKISATPGAAADTDLDLVSGKLYFAANIINTSSDPLPQTGAAGTTMLLLLGGSLFAVTMLFLVTKKRLYNQG